MKDLDNIHFNNRNDFRKWLMKNHDKSPGIWMVFHKKHTKKANITYDDALDEAICFGWIDSLVKKIDEDIYVRKFTPRANIKNWSEINKMRALKLIREGMMTEAGRIKFESFIKTEKSTSKKEQHETGNKKYEIPSFITDAFSKNEPALTHFNKLAPSHKSNYILWITYAKREETIQKRLKESIELLKENKKLGLK